MINVRNTRRLGTACSISQTHKTCNTIFLQVAPLGRLATGAIYE